MVDFAVSSCLPSLKWFARGCAIVLSACTLACGGDDKGDNGGGGGAPVSIRGGERLAWDQAADSVQQLKSLTFKIYVDGNAASLSEITCAETGNSGVYPCSGRLPAMTPGQHELQLTSTLNGTESGRSSVLRVNLSVGVAAFSSGVLSISGRVLSTLGSALAPPIACLHRGPREECYDVETIAFLDEASLLASIPDGRVLVVEGRRTVRVVSHDELLPDPALVLPETARIVGLAIDSRFSDSRFVYVAWTEPARTGESLLNVGRYRELANSLAEAAVIVNGLAFSDAGKRAPIAVDAAGLLYVAVPGTREGVFSGALMRFDRDGLTPQINPRSSPIIARGYGDPTAVSVAADGQVWIAGSVAGVASVATFTLTAQQEWPIVPSRVPISAAHPFKTLPLSDGSPAKVASAGMNRWYVGNLMPEGISRILILQSRF